MSKSHQAPGTGVLDHDSIDIIERWYRGYYDLSVYIGTAAAGMLLLAIEALFAEPDRNKTLHDLVACTLLSNGPGRAAVFFLFVFLAACLVLTLFCVVTTYNWNKTIVQNLLKCSGKDFSHLGDDLLGYASYPKSAKTTGWLSYGTGVSAACFLLLGAVLEAGLITRVLLAYLGWRPCA